MQALLSDLHSRVLIIEPGIGFREEKENCSLITNYSLLEPESTERLSFRGMTDTSRRFIMWKIIILRA